MMEELCIYGNIGPDWMKMFFGGENDIQLTDAGIVSYLNNLKGDELLVKINSFGGSAAHGLAIANILNDCNKKIVTKIEGFACSAASIIFMAGQERIMKDTSVLMIHNARSFVSGDANEMRKSAETLDAVSLAILNSYRKSNLSETELKNLMDQETWFVADDALNYNLATKVEKFAAAITNEADSKAIYNLVLENRRLKETINNLERQPALEDKSNGWDAFFNNK